MSAEIWRGCGNIMLKPQLTMKDGSGTWKGYGLDPLCRVRCCALKIANLQIHQRTTKVLNPVMVMRIFIHVMLTKLWGNHFEEVTHLMPGCKIRIVYAVLHRFLFAFAVVLMVRFCPFAITRHYMTYFCHECRLDWISLVLRLYLQSPLLQESRVIFQIPEPCQTKNSGKLEDSF